MLTQRWYRLCSVSSRSSDERAYFDTSRLCTLQYSRIAPACDSITQSVRKSRAAFEQSLEYGMETAQVMPPLVRQDSLSM